MQKGRGGSEVATGNPPPGIRKLMMTVAQSNTNSGPRKSTPPALWNGQLLHLVCLSGLFIVVALAWNALGRPLPVAFWTAFIVPVMHQVWVWFSWRRELTSAAISKAIGFNGYLFVFFVLFFSRFLSLGYLALVDRDSFILAPTAVVLLTLVVLVPGLYAMFSVMRYFGMKRAAGGDHFDERYREMPPVREGIFRYTDNGMYVFAFLLFWAIALGFNSTSALVIAAYSHAYIWVHFHATEKPDMRFLYESPKS